MDFWNAFASLFSNFGNLTWQMVVMWGIGALLIYLAIAKKMEPSLLLPMGFGAILISALVCNLILTGATDGAYFHLAFEGQPIAHTDGLWNCLGMVLVGFGCVLLGGCPLRQLVLSGEGSSDSAVTVLGLIVGAAFAHNFGLASSAEGPTANGKIAVVIGLAAAAAIGCLNTFRKKA